MATFARAAVAAALVSLVLVPAADAKVSIGITGWTTQAIGTTPQVKNNKTIDQCFDTGNGQRSLFAIFKGKGISKGTKVSVAVWGGPPNGFMANEPADADVVKDKVATFKWPVTTKKSYTSRYGFSFAKGPFGPENINGVWNVKVLVKGKVARRGKVTVAC
jgi:hypothetical protein